MKLPRNLRHDTRDVDRYEFKLIRAGHYLWGQLRRLRRLNGTMGHEKVAIENAIEIVVEAKRAYREELANKRQQDRLRMTEFWKARR